MEGLVFISYSSKDVVLANKVVSYLEEQGYPCWIAPRNITSGHDYTDMINEAIQGCRAVVLIVSDRSVQSQWVKKELSTAVSYNKPILPFRISHVELTGGLQFMLNNVQWIDATVNPTGKFGYIIDGLEQRLPDIKVDPPRHRWPLIITIAVVVIALAVGALLIWNRHGQEDLPPVAVVDDTAAPQDSTDNMVIHPNDNQVAGQSKKEVDRKESNATKDKVKEVNEKPTKVAEVPPVVEPVVEEQPQEQPQVTAPDTAGQAQARQAAAKERAYQKKLRLAKNLYIDHKYREALSLFEELRKEKPQDKEVNAYIKECKNSL